MKRTPFSQGDVGCVAISQGGRSSQGKGDIADLAHVPIGVQRYWRQNGHATFSSSPPLSFLLQPERLKHLHARMAPGPPLALLNHQTDGYHYRRS